ncbi:MAG: efflux RND transporter periplasmic adaptor subunit [Deferribacterales bacterium]
MKKIIIPVIIIAAVAVIFFLRTGGGGNTDAVTFSGTVEVTDVALSFKTSGRVTEVLFAEGDTVKQGEDVAMLDDADHKLAVKTAEANASLSRASLDELLAGSRKQEIKNAEASVEKAQAALDIANTELAQAKTDRERYAELYKSKGVSRQDFEKYDTAYKKAVNGVKEAEASLTSARQTMSMTVEGTRSETIKKAHASLEVALSALNTARQNLTYTVLKSPVSGRVLTRPVEPGEYVQTGSVILTVADLKDAWVRGYVNETSLGRIKLGDIVDITTDTYPDKVYKGRISYIADEAEFTPKAVQTQDERVNFMYRIKVAIDNHDMELKYGMPVDGNIILSK